MLGKTVETSWALLHSQGNARTKKTLLKTSNFKSGNLFSNLYPPELQRCYFLFNHKQICLKVPILLYFVRPKRSSDNCYISCFLTEKTPLIILGETLDEIKKVISDVETDKSEFK